MGPFLFPRRSEYSGLQEMRNALRLHDPRKDGTSWRCQRKGEVVEVFPAEEWPPQDRELDDALDRWLTTNEWDDEPFDDQLDE
jgi:hypothetical protein